MVMNSINNLKTLQESVGKDHSYRPHLNDVIFIYLSWVSLLNSFHQVGAHFERDPIFSPTQFTELTPRWRGCILANNGAINHILSKCNAKCWDLESRSMLNSRT